MAKTPQQKQQEQILLLLLVAGVAGYYFLVYLPEEEKKKQQATQQPTPTKTPEELKAEEEEDAKIKGRIWDLPIHSWADREVKKIASTLIKKYQEDASIFPDGDRNSKFSFSRSANYDIHFPPALQEYYDRGKDAEQENCYMLKPKEELILSEEIKNWIAKVEKDPIRGQGDKNKKDNSAIFYGAPGTGKTRTIQNVCYEANKYPLVEIKGSSLTPTKEDQESKLLPLKKFVYTISELEWVLTEVYGFEREKNGEVRYILFVDEADQISNNALTHDPTKLRFLKECLEGVDQSSRSNNLWVFATNHLEDVEPAVYREGRLSNPLDFSWTWGEFKKYAEEFSIYHELPERWQKTSFLNSEDNKLVKRFNTKLFQKEFLGDDKDKPTRKKFWPLFIENNPDARYFPDEEENEDENQKNKDSNNNNNKEEVEEEEPIKIEIGEFLEFFWSLHDSRDLMYYDGTYKSPKQEEVKDKLTILDGTFTNGINALITSLDKMREEMEETRKVGDKEIKDELLDMRKNIADLKKKAGI